ncbi:AsmA-like C-terminal region-containing protein [Oceanicella sp. SM1341]|uniref:YhdP family protein n=1 Tax=Oceanicella sp. SM1341 TaxID=1548889 RepID=UPI000E4F18FC|nr:AsmA-like C-terminal region-containing protein [Oceanicella sp. SM1341]
MNDNPDAGPQQAGTEAAPDTARGPATPPGGGGGRHPRRRRRPATRIARHGLHSLGRLFIALLVLVVVLAGLLVLRLQQGPVEIPFAAEIAKTRLERQLPGNTVEIGSLVFGLGRGEDEPAGLRLRDLVLRDSSGATIFSVPEVGARLRLSDLMRGEIAPTEVFVAGAAGRIHRDADGRFTVLLLPVEDLEGESAPGGAAPGAAPPAGTDETVATPGGAPAGPAEGDPLASRRESAFQAFMSALAADKEPALRRLTRIRLIRARLRYVDDLSGRVWTARNGAVVLQRSPERITGAARIRLEKPGRAPTALALTANYAFGASSMAISARFDNAWAGDVADQIPALEWIRPLEAPLSGTYEIDLGLDGSLGYLTGRAELGSGELRLGDEDVPLTGGMLDITYDGRSGHFTMNRLAIDTEQAAVTATGDAELTEEDGRFTGITTQLTLSDIVAAPRDQFAAPVRFAGGRLALKARFEPFQLEIGEARLIDGDQRISVSGTIARESGPAREGGAWHMALDASASGITAQRLAALWPLDLARGGRKWVSENMREGVVTRLVAGLRFDGETPEFSMNFSFKDGLAYPLPTLPPIVDARGIGSLDLEGLSVTLQSGRVEMEGFEPIDMSGSVFSIPDFGNEPQHADARLKGKGPLPAVLTLIDQPPLRLLSKIGLDPGFARGRAEVDARLTFPLVKDLDVDDLQAQASATVTDASADSPVAALPLSAERLALTADNSALRVSGVVRAGPARVDMVWNERFSPSQSNMSGTTTITPQLLAALGAGGTEEVFAGGMPARVSASLAPGAEPRFRLEGDLTPVLLTLPGLGWTKPAETEGSLVLAGRVTDSEVRSNVSLEAADLALEGSARIGLDGRFAGATFPTFRLGEAIDSTLSVIPRENAPLRLRLRGGSLDLLALGDMVSAAESAAPQATAPAETPATPPAEAGAQTESPRIAVDFDLESLIITPRIRIEPATGRLRQNRLGRMNLAFEGLANGGAQSDLTIGQTARGLTVQLDSEDAGRFLRDTAYFGHAYGGRMRLMARIPTGPGDVTGQLALRDIQVRDDPTLSQILSVASITGVVETLATGGLTFNDVDAPFAWRGGRLVLGKTRATGPSLGITVEGVYDEAADSLDLEGVFSPAFILNGLLSGVPLLGDLLTGGEGEGVFGFSYSVSGSAEDPDVSVNPLSILTPGALRSIFSSSNGEAPVPDPGPMQLEGDPAAAPVPAPLPDDANDR